MSYHAQMPLWRDKLDAQKIDHLSRMVNQLYRVTFAEACRNLAQILETAVPADDKEAQDIAIMREMLDKYPDVMFPSCEVGHFTGSALVCDNQGRVLLHHHKNLNKWLQFGGHSDLETNFADVAMRETQEETGLRHLIFYPQPENLVPIDFDIHKIPASKGRPEHLHLDLRYMILTIDPDSLNPPPDESQQMQWLTYNEILKPENKEVDPALKRLVRKCQDRYVSPQKFIN